MSDVSNNARVNVYINGQSGIAEIDKLERKMQRLGREINRVGRDSDVGRKLAQEMHQAQGEIDQLTKKLDLSTMSLRQLNAEARRLSRLRSMAQPGTQEFANLNTQLGNVNSRIRNVESGLGSFGQAWKKVWEQLKGVNMALVVAFGGGLVVNWIKDIFRSAADLSDQLADVRKTTGMTKDEVKSLNTEINQIDTRTARKELRDMAIVAGQIGVAKQDVAGFVKAVDVANVALGDEFTGGAQQVAEEMGKLRNVFSDIKSQRIDQDILHISNAINELGADGFATGPVISENANRIGGYGIQVGLTTGQVLGLSAAQQELNITSERGSTAIVKILQKMLTNVEDFASVAGVEIGQFRKMLDTDLFGAFLKVVEGSKLAGNSNTKLAAIIKELDVDGAGASEVMAKFGANVGMIKQKADLATESLKKTDSILNEFSLKNENAAASAEKMGRALSGWFTKKFTEPAGDFLVWLGKATGAVKSLSEKTEQERLELIMTESKIKDVNTKQEDRIKLIKELQDKYPEYLGSLNAEKASNEDVALAIRRANNELTNKIILQRTQEKVDEKAEKAAKYAIKRAESEMELRKVMSKIITENPTFKLQEGTILQQFESVKKQWEDARKGMGIMSLYRDLIDAKNNYTSSMLVENFETKRLTESTKEREALLKSLGITLEETTKKAVTLSKVDSAVDISTSNSIHASGESDSKKSKKEPYKVEVDTKISELERYKSAMQQFNNELANLYRSDREVAILEATRKTDELLDTNKQLQFDMFNVIQFGDEAQRKFAKQQLEKLISEEVKLEEEKRKKILAVIQEFDEKERQARKDAAALITEDLKSPMQKEIEQVQTHYANLIALAIKYGLDTTALAEKREKLIAEITGKYQQATEKETETKGQRIERLIGDYGQAALSIVDPVVTIVQNGAEKQIAAIEDYTNSRIERLDEQRQRGILSEEDYQKRRTALEKRTAKEIGAINRKKIIADRIAAQAQVAFNTAQAVSKAWNNSPTTFGLPWSAAAIIMGGLQSAAIWSEEIPEYALGGRAPFSGVANGPSHANGGIDMINTQTGQRIGNLQGGEPIFSIDTYRNNPEIVERLLHASMHEGGRRLDLNDMLSSVPRMNIGRTTKASSTATYATGGVAKFAAASSSDNKLLNAIFQELKASRLERKNPIKAFTVLRDVDETQSELSRVRAYADIGTSKVTSSTAGKKGKSGSSGKNGIDGTDGSEWYSDAGIPSDSIGVDGDFYLNSTNGDYYKKEGGTWL